ncbi:MAG: MFS transporter [Promethearchaeota archaeon]
MEKEQVEFKNYYIAIFSSNYLFQGIDQSLFAVIIPIYLIQYIGVLDAAALAFLGSIIGLPWIFKVFFGIIGDKVGSKKIGRRRPWIIGMMSMAGVMWALLGTPNLFNKENAITVFTVMGILIFTGVAFSDTIIDGLLLDICPKEKLGRASGFNWGLRSVGAIAGGPVLAILVVYGGLDVPSLFIIIGILMIASSLLTIFIKEPKQYPEVMLMIHLKEMFNNKRDFKTYIFSLFAAIVDSVVILFVTLFLLIQIGLISSIGTSLSLTTTDPIVYLYQGNMTMIISVGIVIGAIVGGQVADKKSRRLSVYLAYAITTISLLLMLIPTIWGVLLFFASLIGLAIGWRHSSYAAVVTEISKQHPAMDSTYYSLTNAFANLGGVIGLALTGVILSLTASYLMVFLFMALISNLGLVGFFLLSPTDYEFKLSRKESESVMKSENDLKP